MGQAVYIHEEVRDIGERGRQTRESAKRTIQLLKDNTVRVWWYCL